jgi:hypothetical protein
MTADLDKLIAAVEAGDDARVILKSDAAGDRHMQQVSHAFHGSLDAAKALHDALLPGWVTWDASHTYFGYEWSLTNGDDAVYTCSKDTPARAWLLAILRAYRWTLA